MPESSIGRAAGAVWIKPPFTSSTSSRWISAVIYWGPFPSKTTWLAESAESESNIGKALFPRNGEATLTVTRRPAQKTHGVILKKITLYF
jgi:hypothetical protein